MMKQNPRALALLACIALLASVAPLAASAQPQPAEGQVYKTYLPYVRSPNNHRLLATSAKSYMDACCNSLSVSNLDGSKALALPLPVDVKAPIIHGTYGGSWSPEGDQLAYYSTISDTISLHTIDSGITSLITITTDLPTATTYEWAPVGTKLAYTAANGTYVSDSHGGTPTKLLDTTGQRLIWSPDARGLVVASASTTVTGTENLAFADVAGGGSAAIAEAALPNTARWSPRGGAVAFATASQVALFTTADRSLATISADVGSAASYAGEWSPDGISFAFLHSQKLSVYTLADKSTKDIAANVSSFSWSATGRLAYLADATRETTGAPPLGALKVSSADGSELIVIATSAFSWAWSPDGMKLAFGGAPSVAGASGSTAGTYIAKADGSQAKLANANAIQNIRWSPDGSAVALTAAWLFGSNTTSIVQVDGTQVASVTGSSASWSPDGAYVIIYDGVSKGPHIAVFAILDRNGAAIRSIDATMGSGYTWSPD